MKRLSTLFIICLTLLFAPAALAQDGGKKKDKKKKSTQQVDSTATKKDDNASGGGGGEITIDEPGNTRGKTKNQSSHKTDGDTLKSKGTEAPPKEAEKATEKPKEETAQEGEVGAPAEGASQPNEAAPAPPPPPGAGGLDASGSGTSLTIDEAGTQKVKKPTDALGNKVDVNPTNLTIDEAGTQKVKKTVEAPNLTPNADSLKQKAGGKVLDLIKPR